MRLAGAFIFVAALALGAPAYAQPAPPGCPAAGVSCIAQQPFVIGGKNTLSASTSSSRVALTDVGQTLSAQVVNAGTVDAWCAPGNSTVVATTATPSVLAPAGGQASFPIGTGTYIACITGSSTASLTIYTGTGVPQQAAPGGSSGPASNVNVINTPLGVTQGNISATGQTVNSATLNAAVSVAVPNGMGTIAWTVSGLTASGASLASERSNDGGTTWSTAATSSSCNGGTCTGTVTADGQFGVDVGGATNMRLRVSVAGTGTVTVSYNASVASSRIGLVAALPAGSATIGGVTQALPPWAVTLPLSPTLAAGSGVVPTQSGAVLSATNPSFTAVTDGTNGVAAIKPASTPAAATDKAIVVAVRPGDGPLSVAGSNVGGYDTNVSTTPTVTASAYAASNCVGGKQTVAVFRTTTLPEGILNFFSFTSAAGNTAALTVYIFKTSPTGSTCTDKSTFTLATADLPKLVTSFVIAPSVPQGATASFAQQAIATSVVNGDSGTTANLYVMMVANAAFTPGSTTDISFTLGVSQD